MKSRSPRHGRRAESPSQALQLTLLASPLAIVRLSPHEQLPPWMTGADLFSVTRTSDELSVVCADAGVPEEVIAQRGWRAFRVAGPIDFSVVGVLASIVAPLAEATISVFAIATYDTDYVLVSGADVERAVEALSGAGHEIGLE